MSLRDELIERVADKILPADIGKMVAEVAVDSLHVVELVEALEEAKICLECTFRDGGRRHNAAIKQAAAALSTIKQDG